MRRCCGDWHRGGGAPTHQSQELRSGADHYDVNAARPERGRLGSESTSATAALCAAPHRAWWPSSANSPHGRPAVATAVARTTAAESPRMAPLNCCHQPSRVPPRLEHQKTSQVEGGPLGGQRDRQGTMWERNCPESVEQAREHAIH